MPMSQQQKDAIIEAYAVLLLHMQSTTGLFYNPTLKAATHLRMAFEELRLEDVHL